MSSPRSHAAIAGKLLLVNDVARGSFTNERRELSKMESSLRSCVVHVMWVERFAKVWRPRALR
jgi:hypothetical protein